MRFIKTYITFILVFSIQLYVGAQDTTTTYYDKEWNECSKQRAVYFGKRYLDANEVPHADDYYISGKIQMTGTYLKKNYKKKNGLFTWYYESGQIEYSGNYIKGNKVGKWTWWRDSGQVEKILIYNEKGLLHGPASYWFANGELDSEGSYVNGLYDGIWKFYHENGQESSREVYSKGKLLALELWNEAGEPEKVKTLSTHIEPEFVGGETAMAEFIRANVVYPEVARKNMIQGIVYIQFVVGYTGELENIIVLKSAHQLLDDEALRVIKLMPAWIPGKMHNRPVRVRYQIPIRFNIT
jgi:TonB family protein